MNFTKAFLGQQLAMRLYRKICVARFRRAGLVFVHVPKAAGTSIAKVAIGKRAGHFTASEIKEELGVDIFAGMFKFSVVRNPYDRLVSAYHYAKQGGGSDGGISSNPTYKSDLFSTFDSFVFNWLMKRDVDTLDYVFRTQASFIYDEDNCLVDYIGHVEDLNEVEVYLSRKLNRPVDIGVTNISKRDKGYSAYYTSDTKNAVYEIYKKDFIFFKYDK